MSLQYLHKHYFTTILLVLILILSAGCEDKLPTRPPATGTITGKIILYEDYTINNVHPLPISDRSGVTVTLEGTIYTTVTKTDGTWELKNIPAGIYTILFEKDGFSWHRIYNQQFVGNGTLYVISPNFHTPPDLISPAPTPLYKKPSFSATTLRAEWGSSGPTAHSLILTSEISTPAPNNGIRQVAFYGSDNREELMSIDQIIPYRETSTNPGQTECSNNYYVDLRRYPSGTTFYVRAYPISALSLPGAQFINPLNNNVWYPAVSDQGSEIISVVVP